MPFPNFWWTGLSHGFLFLTNGASILCNQQSKKKNKNKTTAIREIKSNYVGNLHIAPSRKYLTDKNLDFEQKIYTADTMIYDSCN